MLHLDPGHLLKQLAGQMRLLPVPGDASVSLPGCAFARRHDRRAGGLAVVQDAMTMLEIPSDESSWKASSCAGNVTVGTQKRSNSGLTGTPA